MSGARRPKIHRYQNLTTLTAKAPQRCQEAHCVLLYAYNRTGKTRLSMEFKDQGKRNRTTGQRRHALFQCISPKISLSGTTTLMNDTDRQLKINENSSILQGPHRARTG